MGQTTFSGPVTAGTVKDTTGTTAGSIRNVGNVVLSQTTAVPAAAGATTVAVLPAGSQILDIQVNTTTVFNAATTLTVGNGTTANKFVTSTTITSVGLISTALAATPTIVTTEISNIGTSDVTVVATTAGSAATGAATITVTYIQKTSSGTEGPTP